MFFNSKHYCFHQSFNQLNLFTFCIITILNLIDINPKTDQLEPELIQNPKPLIIDFHIRKPVGLLICPPEPVGPAKCTTLFPKTNAATNKIWPNK